ncbi:MAG: adenosine deaminase, partial [Deltaproteobacteria bacterium]|nr:adenosine deaminase [Deltaproteobacteria bacterium]
KPQLGCNVVTRYQAYISRSGTDSGMFGEMIAAYEAAMVEPRIVALNLVGPEDGSAAMANYDRLMAMLGYLNGYYEGLSPLRLSLHAGEITPASIPPGYELDETQHIRKAVEIAGARRIGHGIDVLDENDPGQLFEQLREQDILVEICLASNDIILEVAGAGHPIHDYIDQGVPIALATDDQGVARSTLAAEFVRAVADQGLDYYQLKTMVRASLQYSFLQGDSLWADYRGAMVAAECAPADGDTPVTQPPSGACETFLQDNARAEVQRELEARFEAFESTF